MNSIIVSGRLTKDGEVVEKDSFKVWKNSVAVQRDYKEKGKDTYTTDFFELTAFGGQVDYLTRNAKKGDIVVVQGKLYFDDYTAKDGSKRKNAFIKVDTVNVLSKYSGNGVNSNATNSTNGLTEIANTDADFIDTTDDDGTIPF